MFVCLFVLNEKIPEELRVIISRKFQDRVWDIEEMIECVVVRQRN